LTTPAATANPGYTLSDAFGGQESPFYREYGIDPNGANTLFGNSFNHANNYCVSLMYSLQDTLRLTQFYVPVTQGPNAGMVVGSI